MNILHTECSMNWGGQEYRTILEHNHLNKTRHTSYLACAADSVMFRRAKELGAVNLVAVDFRKTWRLDVALKLFRFCRRHRIDVINSHGGRDSALCLLAFWSGVAMVRSRHITNPVRKKFSYQYLCSHVLAAAHIIKTMLTEIGVDENKITALDESIDLDAFKPSAAANPLAAEFNVRAADTVVVNIGMIRGDKGQQYFFDAAHAILQQRDDIKFFLIGEGTGARELEIALRARVREHQLESRFIMPGYRADIPDWIRLADIAVIASTSTEAQSQVAPQAFAGGKPVIATNVGGLPELVKDGVTGILVPPCDAAALQNAIIVLADDKKLRGKLGGNAYKLAQERLSFSLMMEKTLALYEKIANKRAC